jgi:hypothetical protein
MALSPEQVRIHNAETVAFCIGDVQNQLKTVAERLTLRRMTTEVVQLGQAYQELETLKRNLMALTPYGRE